MGIKSKGRHIMKAREFITLTCKAGNKPTLIPTAAITGIYQDETETRVHHGKTVGTTVTETVDEIMAKIYPDEALASEYVDITLNKGFWEYKGHRIHCDHDDLGEHYHYITDKGEQCDLVLCAREADNG